MLPSPSGMTPSPHGPSPDPTFYERHFPKLVAVATSELALPETEAIALVHDVLLSTMRHLSVISDIDAWLHGAMTSAAHRLAEVRS